MSIEKILINRDIIVSAQEICSIISNELTRTRAVANSVGAEIAAEYFKEQGIEADEQSGLHNVPQILEKAEISDIYLNNNAYIDVRLCINDNELCVPVFHFENDIKPAAYMFIKITQDLANAEVLGFILSEGIEQNIKLGDYYSVEKSALSDYESIKEYLDSETVLEKVSDIEIYQYFENTENIEFIKKLINSRESRERFIQLYKAQSALGFLSENKNNELDSFNFELNTEEDESESHADSSFEYSTVATPSLNLDDFLDNTEEEEGEQGEQQQEEIENAETIIEDTIQPLDIEEDDEPEKQEFTAEENVVQETTEETNSDIVENLFVAQPEDSDEVIADEDFDINAIRNKKKNPIILFIVLIIALLGAGCYFLISNLNGGNSNNLPTQSLPENLSDSSAQQSTGNTNDVMPVESVEKSANNNNENEGTAVSIPAIENNLDASVLVSNLKIDWEVPAGYASNTSATRYFVKLGKIIQLNLKTELLLLNKPPLSNKITIEIKYNHSSKTFEPVGVIISSGEKTIDDLIIQTVRKALKMKLNTNMDSFGKISGNPVLVIRL